MASRIDGSNITFSHAYQEMDRLADGIYSKEIGGIQTAAQTLGGVELSLSVANRASEGSASDRGQRIESYWGCYASALKAAELAETLQNVVVLLNPEKKVAAHLKDATSEFGKEIGVVNNLALAFMAKAKNSQGEFSTLYTKMIENLGRVKPQLVTYIDRVSIKEGLAATSWFSKTEIPLPEKLGENTFPHLIELYERTYQHALERIRVQSPIIERTLSGLGAFSSLLQQDNSNMQHQKVTVPSEEALEQSKEAQLQKYWGFCAAAAQYGEFVQNLERIIGFLTPPLSPSYVLKSEDFKTFHEERKGQDSKRSEMSLDIQSKLQLIKSHYIVITGQLSNEVKGHILRFVDICDKGGLPLSLVDRGLGNAAAWTVGRDVPKPSKMTSLVADVTPAASDSPKKGGSTPLSLAEVGAVVSRQPMAAGSYSLAVGDGKGGKK